MAETVESAWLVRFAAWAGDELESELNGLMWAMEEAA